MSARSVALREGPLGLHVGLVVVLAVLLAIGITVTIWFPRTMADTGSGLVRGVSESYSSNQMSKESAIHDYRIRPHGPNQMPKR